MVGREKNNPPDDTNPDFSSPVADGSGEELLRLARSAIRVHLRDGLVPVSSKPDPHPSSHAGLFVTLWKGKTNNTEAAALDQSALRGCIGQLQSTLPLPELVQQVAVAASTRDPRFPPLTLAELETTIIEIAILSPMREITDLNQISIGQDGLMIEGNGRRGLLLPKVAVRMGWDQRSFLTGVCNKASLLSTYWPSLYKLYAFTTRVYEERGNYV